jgi:hypothetical protein
MFKPPLSAHETLRLMAVNSGWLETGGRVVRNLAGDAVGRTRWVGRPDWARGFPYSPDQLLAIVEKAIAGGRLGKMQHAILGAMLAERGFSDLDWRWGSMSEDEKESALDELFGADTRPEKQAPKPLDCDALADFVKRQLAA